MFAIPQKTEAIALPGASPLERPMTLLRSHSEAPLPPGHEDLLVKVGASKDRAAFVTLFEYYAPRVKSYLLKHGASDTAAEEVVQNTFVTLWEKAAGYDPKKAAASTWIFTIARNKRIDALRRDKFIEVNTDDPAIQNASYSVEETYADPETVQKLNSAIERLPEDQAQLLRMAFFEDKSHQAISDETHLPLGTVKSRLRLAMEKLKKQLKGSGS